jgi:hypothetical protein
MPSSDVECSDQSPHSKVLTEGWALRETEKSNFALAIHPPMTQTVAIILVWMA